jgi:hypothetical protein
VKKTLAILIATSMLIVGFQNSAYAYDEVVDANQFDQDFKSGLPFYPRNVQNESGSTVVKYFYEENLHRISVAYSCDSGANWSQKTIPLGNWGQPQPLVGVSRDGQTILVAWGWGTSNPESNLQSIITNNCGISWTSSNIFTSTGSDGRYHPLWIDISEDGSRIFLGASYSAISVPSPSQNRFRTFTSKDGGKNWNATDINTSPQNQISVSTYADFANDRLYVMYTNASAVGKYYLAQSSDFGKTWTEETIYSDLSNTYMGLAPKIVRLSENEIIYYNPHIQGLVRLSADRSALQQVECHCTSSQIQVNSTRDTAYVLGNVNVSGKNTLRFFSISLADFKILNERDISDVGTAPSLFYIQSLGMLYSIYIVDRHAVERHSWNFGQSWSAEMQLNSNDEFTLNLFPNEAAFTLTFKSGESSLIFTWTAFNNKEMKIRLRRNSMQVFKNSVQIPGQKDTYMTHFLGEKFDLSEISLPKIPHYEFLNWEVLKEGSSSVATSSTVNIDGNLVVKAHYQELQKSEIKFVDSVTGLKFSKTIWSDEDLVMPDGPTYKDRRFLNWNSSANGKGTAYAVGQSISNPGSPKTFYANSVLVLKCKNSNKVRTMDAGIAKCPAGWKQTK